MRPSARSSRTGSDGPRRLLRLVDRVLVRDGAGRRWVDRLLDPDERVLGRGRVGVRVATHGA
jgi:hypothetical protein